MDTKSVKLRIYHYFSRGESRLWGGGGNGMGARKRDGVRPTHEWELLLPLFEWPEQEDYEAIRPLVLSHILVLSASL